MSENLLMGLDFGTGGCKVTLIDSLGQVAAAASQDYPTYHPLPQHSEQHPDDWFKALIACLRRIGECADLNAIAAISVDGSTHNAVLLDRHMKVIRPTIMWTDQRSTAEVEFLENAWGDDIFRVGYQKVAPTWTLPQLLWIKNHEPDNFAKIHRIMFVKDYVRYLLTGSWETDFIDAQGTLLFDMERREWSPLLCGLIGLPLEMLPPICEPTDVTGTITAQAALLTGLKVGTPVVCGTSDVTAEDFGAGAINPEQCVVKMATAGNINVMTDGPMPTAGMLTYSHVVPGLWYSAAATNAAASAMRWFRDACCGEERMEAARLDTNVYKLMEAGVADVPAGADGLMFHPYLLGERAPYWDAHLRASFTGATMGHGKSHFVRAVMEGVAFSLKDCFRLVQELGLTVSELILIGGGAKSRIWSQIICDVFGRPVTIPASVDASYGTALLAGIGVGIFKDPRDAVRQCVRTEGALAPVWENHRHYEQQFERYRETHDKLADVYKKIG